MRKDNGLMTAMLAVPIEGVIPSIVDASTNDKNMKMVMAEWNLGPEKASEEPTSNKEYWVKMADVWQTSEKEARRQVCSNCEYFENTPEMMEAMDSIAFNSFDADGGGRGYCHKFEFICHNLRACQAWERKEYIAED